VLAGCIIPPSLSLGSQDAAQNSPPAIESVQVNLMQLPNFSPIQFAVGTPDTMILSLLDSDVDDTLYVGLYVDYLSNAPTPARSTCMAGSANVPQRTAICSLNGVCEPKDVGQVRQLSVVVFDRMVLDTGTPRYMAMPPDGLSTSNTYQLSCVSEMP